MTEHAKKLLLLYYKQSRKIRRVSGLPPLTFKAKKAGTLKNYRIYGQTVDGESVGDRTGNLFDGELVLGSFAAADGSFFVGDVTCVTEFINVKSNTEYSIHITGAEIRHIGYYGGTFSYLSPTIREDFTFVTPNDCNQIKIVFRKFDQSKIDLTIFPTNTIMLNEGSTALPYEPYGYKVPVTVEGKNLLNPNLTRFAYAINGASYFTPYENGAVYLIPIKNNTAYTIKVYSSETIPGVRLGLYNKSSPINGDYVTNLQEVLQTTSPSLTIINTTYKYLVAQISSVYFNDYGLNNIMLNTGSTALPYEPYQVPVTTPIYLPEQIKKFGDEAEYISYSEQKLHRVGADDIDVTLPALPVLPGTNTLTVGTEVQPSNVYIKYEGER